MARIMGTAWGAVEGQVWGGVGRGKLEREAIVLLWRTLEARLGSLGFIQ